MAAIWERPEALARVKRLIQAFSQEGEAALAGQCGALGVVAAAQVAVEAVAGRIEVDRYLGMEATHFVDVFQRDRGVLLAEMQQHRAARRLPAELAACRLPVAAAVGYYGGQIRELSGETPRCPILLHFGDQDAAIPLDDVEAVRGLHPEVPIHLYPAGHGFNCDLRGSYHAESAALARERSLAFLDEHLN